MSIADDLIAINNAKLEIKTAIESKGITVGDAPLSDYAGFIDSIEIADICDMTQPTWVKPSAWPDLASIFNASTMPNKRWAVLFIAGSDTWTNINMGGGTTAGSISFETSDGASYATANITHAWNPASDIDGGDGTKLRWLIVGNNNSTGLNVNQMNSNPTTWGPVWLYMGSGTYNLISPGSATQSSANRTIRCIEQISPAAFNGATLQGTYSNCESLECFRWRTTSTPTSITAEMNSCQRLFEFPVPNTITSLQATSIFSGDRRLKFTIPTALTTMQGNASLGGMLEMCEMNFPSSYVNMPSNGLSSGSRIKTIQLSNAMCAVQSFIANNPTLEEVTFTGTITSFADSLFSQCPLLDNVVMPDTVTSIGTSTFSSCTRLTNIHFSTGLLSISSQAFNQCSGLRGDDDCVLTLPSTLTSLGPNAFDSTNIRMLIIPTGVSVMANINTIPAIRYLGNMTSSTSGVTALNSNTYMYYVSFGTLDIGLTMNACVQLTRQVLADILISLKDNTGIINRTLTLGTTNLNKMSVAEKAVATAKNWTLA